MQHDYYSKLSITLETCEGLGFDEPKAISTVITTELSDCSIHAWFKLFEQLLGMAGFSTEVIMQGGAQLAFNESRSIDAMRKVAHIYDLKLQEDVNELNNGSGTEILA